MAELVDAHLDCIQMSCTLTKVGDEVQNRGSSPFLITMTEQEHKAIIATKNPLDHKYMIASEAYHLLGELSRKEDLCHIYGETDNYYVGSWVTGFGFFNVLFPKDTTRDLTQAEKDMWNNRAIQIGSQPPVKLDVD